MKNKSQFEHENYKKLHLETDYFTAFALFINILRNRLIIFNYIINIFLPFLSSDLQIDFLSLILLSRFLSCLLKSFDTFFLKSL